MTSNQSLCQLTKQSGKLSNRPLNWFLLGEIWATHYLSLCRLLLIKIEMHKAVVHFKRVEQNFSVTTQKHIIYYFI